MKILINIVLIFVLAVATTGTSTNNNAAGNSDLRKDNSSKVTNKISRESKKNVVNSKINLFSFLKSTDENDEAGSFVIKSALLNLKKESLNQLLKGSPENMTFSIPAGNLNIELELTQSFPLAEDFKFVNLYDKTIFESVNQGLHYTGIIKGKEKSIASVSVFENLVMGIISDETGNYVLGPLKNADNSFSDQYIFYNDADMKVKDKFKCALEGNEEKFLKAVTNVKDTKEENLNDNFSAVPVKIYFELDYRMYTDFSGNLQNLENFVTGMFNSVKTIYQNENIPMVISQIGYWPSEDPYRTLSDSYEILLRFGGINQNNFGGNIAHLLSTRNEGLGGIAWIRVLCTEFNSQDSSGRYAFSNIEPTYNNFPAYSWTVNVVAHEMGHSIGSRHTHSCAWPTGSGGSIGAIDSCYNAEGNCFATPRPRVGTIMSYCHLWSAAQGGGINLSSGFGPLPGDTIRLRYSQAACLTQQLNSSEPPASFSLAQNFPNPFNPETVIRFALPKETSVTLRVYDVNGRMVASLIENKFYNAGFYDRSFNSSDFLLSSGIYFYKLETKDFSEVKRMVLIK